MELEFVLQAGIAESYPFRLEELDSCTTVDWAAVVEHVLADREEAVEAGVISARFHNTMVEIIVAVAKRVGCAEVALSGGCFQNSYLTERTVRRLAAEGYQPYWHRQVPPNDGGVSFGQAVVAVATRKSR
jgi:hydrogenase maturation protein HypF